MGFCGHCGAAVEAGRAYCGSCGKPVGEAPRGAGEAGALESNIAGALCYLLGFLTGIVFLVLDPYRNDRFVRFHAFQSIFYSVAVIVFWAVWSALLLPAIFYIGFLAALAVMLTWLINLAIFLYWLLLMYKAYNRERLMVPVIGDIAAKQAG
jgi:uncharacterized membrane protein